MKIALTMPRATAGSMGDMAIMAAGTVVVVTGAVTTAVVPPVTPVVPVVTTSCRSLGAAPRRGAMSGRDLFIIFATVEL